MNIPKFRPVRWFLVGLLMGVGSLFAIGGALALDADTKGRMPFAYLCIGLVLTLKWRVDKCKNWVGSSTLPRGTSVGAGLVFGLVVAIALDSLFTQIAGPSERGERGRVFALLTGKEPFGASLLYMPLVIMLASGVGTWVGALFAWRLPSPSSVWVQRLSRGAFALLTLVAIGSILELCRKPDIDAYIHSFEEVGHLPIPGTPRVLSTLGSSDYRPGVPGVRTQEVDIATLVQECSAPGCRLGLAAPGTPADVAEKAAANGPLQGWDSDLFVSRDPTDGVIYCLGVAAEFHRYHREQFPTAPKHVLGEFHQQGTEWVAAPYQPHRWLSRTGPPFGWVIAGALGWAGLLIHWWVKRKDATLPSRASNELWVVVVTLAWALPLGAFWVARFV